jgi:D-3-phosphoglycerate dehydrogenase / 2-oxoglutarate reductase
MKNDHQWRVLCTPASFGKRDPLLKQTLEEMVSKVVYNPFGRPLTATELMPLITETDGYIAGVDEVNGAVIQSAARLKVIACYGVGFDRIDLAAATERGVVVTNSPGANAVSVAELAMALILSLSRRLSFANDAVHQGEWPLVDGVSLRGKTVGLVGLGAIGREMTKRLLAFDCLVLACDPYVTDTAAARLGARLVSLEELLPVSDFISLHAPATSTTRHLVNRDFLEKMKRGAFLINTARGDLVDEGALVEALRGGRLLGAALDCMGREPPEKNNPLFALPQVLLTPHTGSHTDDALNQMGRRAMENCLAVLKGEKPANVVNPEVLDRVHLK